MFVHNRLTLAKREFFLFGCNDLIVLLLYIKYLKLHFYILLFCRHDFRCTLHSSLNFINNFSLFTFGYLQYFLVSSKFVIAIQVRVMYYTNACIQRSIGVFIIKSIMFNLILLLMVVFKNLTVVA